MLQVIRPHPTARGDDLPDGYRAGFALHLQLRPLAKLDLEAGCAVRALVDEDAVHGRGGLDPSGRVDDVTMGHRRSLLRAGVDGDDRFSGCYPDADLEPARALGVEPGHGLAYGVCRADSALGVVLVRRRCAEERHDGVADELLDGAAVALERFANSRVVRVDDPAHVLRVERLRQLREADHVDEDDAHDLPLECGLLRLELGSAGRCRTRCPRATGRRRRTGTSGPSALPQRPQ